MGDNFGFLLFDKFEDMDFVGPWEIFSLWSKYCEGPKNLFTISESKGLVKSVHGLSIQTHYNFSTCPRLDYLLIPGGQGTRKEVDNKNLIAFIQTKAIHCQHLLSVCTGAFLLQKAGLLVGKKATTHWASIDRLKQYSDVAVVQKRFVRDGNLWTSAGISAGIDLAFAFIAALSGEEIAGKIQLHAEYYPDNKIFAAKGEQLPVYVDQK